LSKIDEIYDASESIVLPGLINTHHHFYQTLTRAYPEALNKELFPWLKSLYKVWAHIQPEMLAVSTELALSELLLSGCTTASDHHYLFPSQLENAIDIQIEQAQKIGMRVVLTRGSMSLGEKDGGLPPQSVVQTKEQILSDSERLIKSYHNYDKGAMVQIALAPCSPFSVTTELMQDTSDLAEQYDVRLHTHLAETIDEENFCLEKFGLRTVDYLESVGWLSERTWLAHGIHFNDEEIQKLGQSGVGICHCPSSNMMLASGICRSLELEEAGSNVGLGVDGSASNDGSNMIAELRQGMYLQRLRYGASKISHEHAYGWASKGSAKLLGREDIGEIAVGKHADLALFKLDELRFSGSHDPLAALLLCGAQRADRVMVAGKWRVVDGKIVDKDEAELIHRHSDAAKKLRQLASA
jgi:8-oxoguanine deaminase